MTREIGQVVAGVGDLFGVEFQRVQQLLEAGELVVLALIDVRDAEFGHALGHDHGSCAR